MNEHHITYKAGLRLICVYLYEIMYKETLDFHLKFNCAKSFVIYTELNAMARAVLFAQ